MFKLLLLYHSAYKSLKNVEKINIGIRVSVVAHPGELNAEEDALKVSFFIQMKFAHAQTSMAFLSG